MAHIKGEREAHTQMALNHLRSLSGSGVHLSIFCLSLHTRWKQILSTTESLACLVQDQEWTRWSLWIPSSPAHSVIMGLARIFLFCQGERMWCWPSVRCSVVATNLVPVFLLRFAGRAVLVHWNIAFMCFTARSFLFFESRILWTAWMPWNSANLYDFQPDLNAWLIW